ncbi:MAG TPA: GNAT family N-acetyltransferase [Micromonosporaceae bacterium]|nr:GNAT family N-acetyltransferase [Micromonosporaceae bacterium]
MSSPPAARTAPAGHGPAQITPLRLADGLELRAAVPADLDSIAALLAERGEPADAVDHELVMRDPEAGWSTCAVVVDGDRVVSTATLLNETLQLGAVEIPAGQVELVATEREYEGRGLVRALMGWAHQRSASLGHLAQVMVGIPYFYRQFGYAYAMPIAPVRPVSVPPAPRPTADRTVARRATMADIPAMAALQAAEQAGADLAMPHSPPCWRWLVAREGTTQWLVERDGVAVATGRTTPPEDGGVLSETAAADAGGAHALVRHALEVVGPELKVRERPGTVAGKALAGYLGAAPTGPELYYARVPDAAALLEQLRPVLSQRLAASGFADATGEALVSFFRFHVRLPYAAGEVGPVTAGGTMQAPYSAGGAGVAPDQVAPLLFGPDGLAGLARRHPDVYAGPNADLMHTLFPPVRSDVLTFYVP